MLISNILLHLITIIVLIVRFRNLFYAFKASKKGIIKMELFLIFLIVSVWALTFFGLNHLFK